MTKRAVKRMVREGAFDAEQFDDGKVRRLPVERGWTPQMNAYGSHHTNDDREQGYLKTIKPKSPGQSKLIEAIDARNLIMALGPAGTGKTYLAIAKAVEALEAGKVGRIVLSRPAIEAGESIGFLPGDMEDKLAPYLRPLYDAQNCTYVQLKMLLTRLGWNSTMVVTGDPNQSDLLPGVSGLADVAQKFEQLPNIAVVRLTDVDIVRHPLVAEMLGVL